MQFSTRIGRILASGFLLLVSSLLAACGAPDPAPLAVQPTAHASATAIPTATARPTETPGTVVVPPQRPTSVGRVTSIAAASFTRLPNIFGEGDIAAFAFADLDHGWLANGAKILATDDGGTTWHEQTLVDSEVSDIIAVSPSEVWILTKNGAITTDDGGSTWHAGTFAKPPSPFEPPQRIAHGAITYTFCPEYTEAGAFTTWGASDGWATCRVDPQAHDHTTQLFHTGDAGGMWQLLGENACQGGMAWLVFVDDQHGWSAGRGGACTTNNGGVTWTQVLAFDEFYAYVAALQALSPTESFVIVHDPSQAYSARQALLATRDGGATWQRLFVPDQPLSLGGAWQPIGTGAEQMLVATQGKQLVRLASDRTWQSVGEINNKCPQDEARVADISFADQHHGWAAVGCRMSHRGMARTDDGGATWSVLPMPAANTIIVGVERVNEQTGYAVTESGLLWRSDDGGASWQPTDGLQIHAANVAFATPDDGWEVRGEQLFATNDGGVTWKQIDVGVPVRLANLLPDGHGYVIAGTSGKHHSAQADLALYATVDGGHSWQKSDLGNLFRLPSGAQLDGLPSQVYFADTQHGWLRFGVFFATNDGGKTWTQVG